MITALALMSILMVIPQKFQGTTSILIENRDFAFNCLDKIAAQAAIIGSDIIISKIIKKLDLPDGGIIGIKEKLEISTDGSSRVLQLNFSSSDRILASTIPNAIADEYLAASQTKSVNAHIIHAPHCPVMP